MSPNELAALEELTDWLTRRGPMTAREVAARLGVSRQTVLNIEARALTKLKWLVRTGWRS